MGPQNANRMFLTLSPEAIQILKNHSSERKRGELISKLLIEYDRALATQIAIENLEQRLSKVEQALEAMIQNY